MRPKPAECASSEMGFFLALTLRVGFPSNYFDFLPSRMSDWPAARQKMKQHEISFFVSNTVLPVSFLPLDIRSKFCIKFGIVQTLF